MPDISFHAAGVTYNGLHSNPNPTTAQVRADLATTKQHFDHARTYYPQYGGGAVDVARVARDQNLALLLGSRSDRRLNHKRGITRRDMYFTVCERRVRILWLIIELRAIH